MDTGGVFEAIGFGADSVLLMVKLFYLIGLVMYMVFATVVLRQVEMMLSSLGGVLDLPIRLVAWIHLILVLVLIGVVVIL